MPVVNFSDFGTERAPEWAKIAGGIDAMGYFKLDTNSPVEPHFHDNEEFWFVLNGKAKIMTEGKEYLVEKGDVVCTHKGDEHAIIEVIEVPYAHVWIGCNLRGKKRMGHLHRGKDD